MKYIGTINDIFQYYDYICRSLLYTMQNISYTNTRDMNLTVGYQYHKQNYCEVIVFNSTGKNMIANVLQSNNVLL
jgi:hypothetical protein